MEKKILKPAQQQAKRTCGHDFWPTFDVMSADRLSMKSYCIECMMEKLNLKPCTKVKVDHIEDWKDLNKVKILFNR